MNAFTGHLPGSRDYRRLMAGLFFAGIATFAQLYAPQAVLPQIAETLDVSPATAALAVSMATLGLAAAVIPWSMVADRIGRVPAMAIGILAASVLGIIAPFSPDIGVLLAVRLVEGAALGAIPAIALAYISEEVDAGHTATAAGSYIAGTTIGGLSGRLVAGPIGDVLEWRTGMWATAALCIGAAVVFLWLIPSARGYTPDRRRRDERMPEGAGIRDSPSPDLGIRDRLLRNLRSPVQLALYAQACLLMGAFVAVYNYLGFHLMAPPFDLPGWIVTSLFLAYLAGTVSSPWAGALATRHGRLPVLLVSIALMGAGTVVMFVPLLPVILAGLLVFTAGFFAAHAVASGWAPTAAPSDRRAQASALYYLAYYAGSSLFGWCLGYVLGIGWGWFLAAIMALCAVAAALAVGMLRAAPRNG